MGLLEIDRRSMVRKPPRNRLRIAMGTARTDLIATRRWVPGLIRPLND